MKGLGTKFRLEMVGIYDGDLRRDSVACFIFGNAMFPAAHVAGVVDREDDTYTVLVRHAERSVLSYFVKPIPGPEDKEDAAAAPAAGEDSDFPY